MARRYLTDTLKFKVMVRQLKMPNPHVYGHLLFLWDARSLLKRAGFATEQEIEEAVDWGGLPGAFFQAAVDSGLLLLTDGGLWEVSEFRRFAKSYQIRRVFGGRSRRECNRRRRAALKNAPVNDFTEDQWEDILAEHGGKCDYCGRGDREITADHVQPLARGGSHTRSNIVPACRSCNSRKGARTGEEFRAFMEET